jgi:hypothetical protein
VLKDIHYVF